MLTSFDFSGVELFMRHSKYVAHCTGFVVARRLLHLHAFMSY